jgi:hypothetical protein
MLGKRMYPVQSPISQLLARRAGGIRSPKKCRLRKRGHVVAIGLLGKWLVETAKSDLAM